MSAAAYTPHARGSTWLRRERAALAVRPAHLVAEGQRRALAVRRPVRWRRGSAEEWRPIPGWEGFYEVSSLGRVRTVDRRSRGRRVPSRLKQPTMRKGYLAVGLYLNDRQYHMPVHRAVATAFLGDPGDRVVRHLDGDPLNNRANNLAYGTQFDNERDKDLHGRRPLGSACPQAKLVENDIPRIFEMSRGGASPRAIARTLGVSSTTIARVLTRRAWRHVQESA